MTVATKSAARQCAFMAEKELEHLERAIRVAHAQGFVVVSMGSDYWRFRLAELTTKFDLTPNQSERVYVLAAMLGE
jgi:acetolactate synthase regulatory subunit